MGTCAIEQPTLPAGIQVARVKTWPRRHTIVALFSFATALCYVDRVNISIAIIPLARDKGYDAAAKGVVLSSFFWGYLWRADVRRMDGRPLWRQTRARGMRGGMVDRNFSDSGDGFNSFGVLLAMRALLGAGEARNFPAVHSIAARWTIASERSRAISLHLSGISLGTIIALLLSPVLVLQFGWPSVFYSSGALGLVWLAAWWLKGQTVPKIAQVSRPMNWRRSKLIARPRRSPTVSPGA